MNYRASLEVFEGPPDFLLYLVEEEIITAVEIPVGELAGTFREELERLEGDDAGEDLEVCAKLLWRKARALFRPPWEAETEPQETQADEGRRRALRSEQLSAYLRIKQAVGLLAIREAQARQHFRRTPAPGSPTPVGGVLRPSLEAEHLSLDRLWEALGRLQDRSLGVVKVPSPQELTVEEVMGEILSRLGGGTPQAQGQQLSLASLPAPGRPFSQLIVFFLAILELIRRGAVFVSQEGSFGEIFLRRAAADPAIDEGCR